MDQAMPEIFDTDPGSRFTTSSVPGLRLANKMAVSIDGRCAWRDNVFVERVWRSAKYAEAPKRMTSTETRSRRVVPLRSATYDPPEWQGLPPYYL